MPIRPVRPIRRALAAAILLSAASRAPAQCPSATRPTPSDDPNGGEVLYDVLGTYAPGSPSLGTSAAPTLMLRSGDQPPAVAAAAADLGFGDCSTGPPCGRILSIAHRDDEFPRWNFFYLPQTGAPFSRRYRVHFTADGPGAAATLPGHTAGDVYGVEWKVVSSASGGPAATGHVGAGPFAVGAAGAAGDVRDGLEWADVPKTPVLFTVDALGAARLSFLHPSLADLETCDILLSNGDGLAPTVVLKGGALGLQDGDQMNALVVDADGCMLFTLAPGSPSLSLSPPSGIGPTDEAPYAPPFLPTTSTIIAYVPAALANVAGFPSIPSGSNAEFGSLFDYGFSLCSILGEQPSFSDFILTGLTFHDPLGGELHPAASGSANYARAEGSYPLRGAPHDAAADRLSLSVNGKVGGGVQRVRTHVGDDVTVTLDLTGVPGWAPAPAYWAILLYPGRPSDLDGVDFNGPPAGTLLAPYTSTAFNPLLPAVFGLTHTAGFLDPYVYLAEPAASATGGSVTIPGAALGAMTLTAQAAVVGTYPDGAAPTFFTTNAVTLEIGPPLGPFGVWPTE